MNNEEQKKRAEKEVVKVKNNTLKLVFDIVFWVIISSMMILWCTEIVLTKTNKDPLICINEKNYQFEDGTVRECYGIGYKTFEYKRTSIDIKRQFGAFFTKMRK